MHIALALRTSEAITGETTTSLQAFLECGRLALKEGERFAGEVQRTANQDERRIKTRFVPGRGQRRHGGHRQTRKLIANRVLQFLRRNCALALDRRKQNALRDRLERSANARNILVPQDREQDGGAPVAEKLSPGFRQNARARGIVRAVNDGALIPTLETRWPVHAGQAVLDRALVTAIPAVWNAEMARAAFSF